MEFLKNMAYGLIIFVPICLLLVGFVALVSYTHGLIMLILPLIIALVLVHELGKAMREKD